MFLKFILATVATWLIWRWLDRLFRPKKKAEPDIFPNRPTPTKGPSGPVQELAQCPRCQTWKSADAMTSCGRTDCPY